MASGASGWHLGGSWVASGTSAWHLGGIWETSGGYLETSGGIWETSGGCLGTSGEKVSTLLRVFDGGIDSVCIFTATLGSHSAARHPGTPWRG